MLEAIPGHRQRTRVNRIGEGDLVPTEARLADRDLDLGAEILALEKAAVAVDSLRAGELHDAAGRIAAAFDLAAVAVPDAHLEVGRVARFEDDQLVASDPGAPVGNGFRKRRGDLERLQTRVNDHEIIAEAVHLVEPALHLAGTSSGCLARIGAITCSAKRSISS